MSELQFRVSIETTRYAKATFPVLSNLKKKDMRQIKFREWLGKEFHYWGFMEDGSFILPTNIKGPQQQFTGLMDKNKVHIYEGDILAYAWDTMLRLWLIEFSDGSFTNINIGVDGYLGERFKLTQEKCSERVVVGNRFDRPDLLK